VIEILQQPIAENLRNVGIGFGLREGCGHFDGHLLITDRGLERRLIGRQQPIDERLLMLFFPSHSREIALQLFIHSGAGMAEAETF
jgi:hypothetical protein